VQEANTPKVKRQCFFQSTGAKIPIKPLKRGFIDQIGCLLLMQIQHVLAALELEVLLVQA
jgi:hypothetical protein